MNGGASGARSSGSASAGPTDRDSVGPHVGAACQTPPLPSRAAGARSAPTGSGRGRHPRRPRPAASRQLGPPSGGGMKRRAWATEAAAREHAKELFGDSWDRVATIRTNLNVGTLMRLVRSDLDRWFDLARDVQAAMKAVEEAEVSAAQLGPWTSEPLTPDDLRIADDVRAAADEWRALTARVMECRSRAHAAKRDPLIRAGWPKEGKAALARAALRPRPGAPSPPTSSSAWAYASIAFGLEPPCGSADEFRARAGEWKKELRRIGGGRRARRRTSPSESAA